MSYNPRIMVLSTENYRLEILNYWPTDRLIDRLTELLTHSLSDLLTDSLVELLADLVVDLLAE